MLKKLFQYTAILLAVLSIASCSTVQQANLKEIKPFVGIWNDNVNLGAKIVFKTDGTFYNITKENDVEIITHSGNYKVLSNNMYLVDITYARANATYDMMGRQYANYYTFVDKNHIKVSGVVDGRFGRPKLKWENELIRTNTIE